MVHRSGGSSITFFMSFLTPIIYISSQVNHSVANRLMWRIFYGLLKNAVDEHVTIPRFGDNKWLTHDITIDERGLLVSRISGTADLRE